MLLKSYNHFKTDSVLMMKQQ